MRVRRIVGLFAFLALSLLAQAQTVVILDVTPSGTGATTLGFSSAQNYTFTFTLNTAPLTIGTAVQSSSYWWQNNSLGDASIWSSITSTGLSGTFAPVGTTGPYNSLYVGSGGSFQIIAGGQYTTSIGLTTPNSYTVTEITLYPVFSVPPFDFSNASLPDAGAYFSGYTGTYYGYGQGHTAAFDSEPVLTLFTSGPQGFFNVNSITISNVASVPEPAEIFLLAAGLIVAPIPALRRRWSTLRRASRALRGGR